MKPTRLLLLLSLFTLLPLRAHLQLTNDVGIAKENAISPFKTVDYYRVFNGFPIGATFINYGTNDQDSIYVSAVATNLQGDILYSDTIGPVAILSQDSLHVYENELHQFTPYTPPIDTYSHGDYTFEYGIHINGDEDSTNNLINLPFSLTLNSLELTSAGIDASKKPLHQKYFPDTTVTDYRLCTVWDEPNPDKFKGNLYPYYFEAINFVPHADSGEDLSSQEYLVELWEWENSWNDMEDPLFTLPDSSNGNLTFLSGGFGWPGNNDNDTLMGIDLETNIYPNAQSKYLACVYRTSLLGPTEFGLDTTKSLITYMEKIKKPVGLEFRDGVWSILSPTVGIPAMSLSFSDFHWGIEEATEEQISIHPNPAVDELQITLHEEANTGNLEIVDAHGRVIQSRAVKFSKEKTSIDVRALKSGHYVLLIRLHNGMDYFTRFVIER